MAFTGMAPFGSLMAGALSNRIGASGTLLFCGVGCLAASGWIASQYKFLRAEIHPIYRKLGIVPEIAAGMQQAAELTRPPTEQG
jgi:hypothetical protein